MDKWRRGLSGVFGSLYRTISKVNVHHSFWFWTSLAMVFLGDLFVLAVAETCLAIKYYWSGNMDENYTTHEYDVVVIGAGGAGLKLSKRARRGSVLQLSPNLCWVKAHTVMAEGGVAITLANKDERDSWKTHFRDTMKGGKYLNDWRMARIHAQQAPDRIRRAGAVGRSI